MSDKISTLVNLLSPKIGSHGVYANDEFFAPLERMLSETDPIFIPDKYDNHGKWMDGWETRRRRTPGFDWCLIKLGCPGRIKKIEINTKFFTLLLNAHSAVLIVPKILFLIPSIKFCSTIGLSLIHI